jgi:hypothetical protein
MRVLCFTICLFSLVFGCSPKRKDNGGTQQAPTLARCTRVGDTCEFAPGKLGVCVAPEGCTKSGCLLCQSQH